MNKREFITLLGGAAAWPMAARAQQSERMRRIGLLLAGDENDPARKAYVSALTQALAGLGWTDGRNLRMDFRWHGGDANRIRALAQELVELLSEIAPGLKRAAIMFDPDTSPASAFMPSIETAARSLKVVSITAHVHSDAEIETAVIALGHEPGGGLVVMTDSFMVTHRAPIILAAARNNVPAVYTQSEFARDGGLLSYGVDQVDLFRRAASYVDRILRGEKPGDLPVQFPTKYELVINMKTAKALGLTVSNQLQLLANEVIE
jgi:putative ABC transport system substrate-binding protein